MKISFLLAFLLLVFGQNLAAQESTPEQIFDRIYNMEFKVADSLLRESQAEIDPYYFAVLETDKSYWQNVTGTDEPDYEAFEKTLEKFAREKTSETTQKEIRLITLSYQLRYEIKRFKLIDAVFTRQKTLALYSELESRSSDLPLNQQEIFQLYKALIIYFDNYLKPAFVSSKKEQMKEALNKMERLSSSEYPMVKTLASYFAGRTLLKFEKNAPDARAHFSYLSQKYPNNHRFAEYLTDCREQNQ